MRGKNILLLSLIAMMLTVMMVGTTPTIAQTPAVLSIDPAILPGTGLGVPGDIYDVSVNIANATNLWAIQFKVKFAPYVSVLSASEINEGDFMSEGGTHDTFYTVTSDQFEGSFTVVILRMGPEPRVGVSGDGTLVTFKLKVLDAGQSPIDLNDTILLDPDGNHLAHTTVGGFYFGTIGEFVRINFPGGRKIRVGETFVIAGKARNHGDLPLDMRIRYDISRVEDARKIVMYSGQTYTGGGLGEPRPFEYLYIDEFNEWYYEFNGDPTNLFGEPDGSYIEGDTNAQWASLFGFEDISLGTREIADINVECYSRFPNGFSEAVDIDLYGLPAFAWWGSSWGTPDWGWTGTRWIGASVLDEEPNLANEADLNAVELLVYNYHGDAPDVMQIDSIRLKVEFASITPVIPPMEEVFPGGTEDLESITWISDTDHIGTYEVTATLEYTNTGFHWNSWGSSQVTRHFWIVP